MTESVLARSTESLFATKSLALTLKSCLKKDKSSPTYSEFLEHFGKIGDEIVTMALAEITGKSANQNCEQ